MSEFTKTQEQYRWPDVEAVMKNRIGEERTANCFAEAVRLSEQYKEKYNGLKGFQRRHASAAYNIAALFIPLKEAVGSEEAIRILDEVWKPAALKSNAKYDKLPPKLFIMLCRIIAKNAFGNKAGFVQNDISKDKTEVRFDVTSCPYVRIMTDLGCAEACPIVCRQDEYTYGGMRGIVFERTKTLGRGDEKCDFCYRRK
ncbi:MAG: L-2-amino-thiazoline-4-carboxylic acid hydrolase [Lachnospiraceae bacterium]|nr:L-2-amino-thiazoline-4-carboxylic acid hydrolase [Lachnospiraceae bacterium]